MPILTGLHPGVLAANVGVPLAMSLLVALPLVAAYWLLARASRQRRGLITSGSADHLDSLQNELSHNYDRLRRAGEAVPLATDAWRHLRHRPSTMPPPVRRRLARTYHAIEVSNRLLVAAVAYDRRGHLSLRQRRLSLWPTLEEAVRTALAALGRHVAAPPQTQDRPSSATGRAPLADPVPPAAPFNLDAAPRLALLTGPGAQPHEAPSSAQVVRHRPRPPRRKRPAARRCDGQMPLWESVA